MSHDDRRRLDAKALAAFYFEERAGRDAEMNARIRAASSTPVELKGELRVGDELKRGLPYDLSVLISYLPHAEWDVAKAVAWYRETPLPEFGGQTAKELVRAEKAEAVLDCLERLGDPSGEAHDPTAQ